MKPATPEEIEQAIRDMSEWQKQKLTDAFLMIARNHGFLDKPQSLERTQQPESVSAKTAGGTQ